MSLLTPKGRNARSSRRKILAVIIVSSFRSITAGRNRAEWLKQHPAAAAA